MTVQLHLYSLLDRLHLDRFALAAILNECLNADRVVRLIRSQKDIRFDFRFRVLTTFGQIVFILSARGRDVAWLHLVINFESSSSVVVIDGDFRALE